MTDIAHEFAQELHTKKYRLIKENRKSKWKGEKPEAKPINAISMAASLHTSDQPTI
jgi:hypothetical protein